MSCESSQGLTIKDAEIEKRVAGGRTPEDWGDGERNVASRQTKEMCWLVDWLVC